MNIWVKWFDARARILLVSVPFEWNENDVILTIRDIQNQVGQDHGAYYVLLDVGHAAEFPIGFLTQLAEVHMPYIFIFNAGIHGETILSHVQKVFPDYADHFQIANSITHAQLMVYQHRRNLINQQVKT